jgi:hypothetical protein
MVFLAFCAVIPVPYEALARSLTPAGMMDTERQPDDLGRKAPSSGSGTIGCSRLCDLEYSWTSGGTDAADSRSGARRWLLAAAKETTANEVMSVSGTSGGNKGYTLVFSGFSSEEKRGIEEYLVEFPGYLEHWLVRDLPEKSEYHYETSAIQAHLNSALIKMLAYLDVNGEVSIVGDVIEVENIEVRPAAPLEKDDPIVLHLSSARGHQPTYQIGEKLDLLIELNRDAWLYCFYLQGDGRLFKFFPNVYHRVAWLTGGRKHRVPGEIFPFELNITEPPGKESLTCFASNRNVTSELPRELQEMEMSTLPLGTAKQLAEIFRNIPDAAVTETNMIITVSR